MLLLNITAAKILSRSAAVSQTSRSCEVFLSIGTSTVVYPAASLPFEALQAGATVVEINPDPTPLTPKANFVLSGPAGVILPELLRQMLG